MLAISTITYAEVAEGIYYGGRTLQAMRVFRAFYRNVVVFDIDRAVARRYTRLRAMLRQQGLSIAVPDMLIAATSLAHGLTLVTYNRRHFNRVPGLTLYP